MSNTTRVLIAGGGIGGPALAIALRRKGIEPIVVERRSEFTQAGAGMVLSPNGMRALGALGTDLADDVRAAGAVIPPGQVSDFLTARGRSLARTVPILRTQLQEILLQHEVDLRTGPNGHWPHGRHAGP